MASTTLSVSIWRKKTRAARADRDANRHLAFPRGGAGEEHGREVRAGDEENERDRAGENEQGSCLMPPITCSLQRKKRGAKALGLRVVVRESARAFA